MLIVAPRIPAKTVPELVAYAKANPGKLNFGAPAGATPLLVGELFKMRAGIDITTVPYRGAANTMTDMLTGQIDMAIEPTSVTLAHIHEGKIRAARGHQPRRAARSCRTLPTMAESGVPGVVAVSWTGVIGARRHAGRRSSRKLNRAINEALKSRGHEDRAAQARQRSARRIAAGFRGAARRGSAEMGRGGQDRPASRSIDAHDADVQSGNE